MALADVRHRLEKALEQSERDAADCTLVAVSKQQPDDRIDAVLAEGQRVFGENRVQEAQSRWAHRRAAGLDLELRLVGPLQTNKVKDALALFDVVETLDRPKLAEKIAREMDASGTRARLYVQVNTGEEDQKAGVGPGDADAFIAACRTEYDLEIEGLMVIPPADEPPAPHFALLSAIAERNGVGRLSMGMSADFEIAVALGATSVRVGSAVFGARTPRPSA